jgi:hypothetical protein
VQRGAYRRDLDAIAAGGSARRAHEADEERRIDAECAREAEEALPWDCENRIARARLARAERETAEDNWRSAREEDAAVEQWAIMEQDERGRRENQRREREMMGRRRMMLEPETIRQQQADREGKRSEKEEERRDREAKRMADEEEWKARRTATENQGRTLGTQCRAKQKGHAREKWEKDEFTRATIQGWRDEEEPIQQELMDPRALTRRRFRGYR